MKHWLPGCLLILSVACKDKNASTDKETFDPQKVQLVEDLRQQVRKNPDSVGVRMRLVNALDSLGNYTEALVQLDSLVKRDSLNNGLWYAKAQLHESNKDTVAAIRSYERALNIYPSTDAQLSLANLLAEHKDERCLLICQALTKLGMGREMDAHCAFIAGVYYARTSQPAKALEYFDKCINNNYTYMEAYMEKGFIYFEQRKYNEAMQVFDKAITVNNMYADAYYWKAKTFEATGDKQEAITNYQRSLGLDKELKEARAALDKLQ